MEFTTRPDVFETQNYAQIVEAANKIEADAGSVYGFKSAHYDNVFDICEDIRLLANNTAKRHYFRFFIHLLKGAPVSVMTTYGAWPELGRDSRLSLLPKKAIWVEGTAGSAYASGSGIVMKELSLNLSQDMGCNGCVGCAAATDAAAGTWENLGFSRTGRQYAETINGETSLYPVMFLDPRLRPDIWSFHGGRWNLLSRPLTVSNW